MCRLLAPAYDDVTIKIRGEAIMATATNIQIRGTQETRKSNNNSEASKMTITQNIHNIVRSNTKVLAGLVIGGMIAAASFLPGNTSADDALRPVGEVEVAAKIAHSFDMDLLDLGFYDAKVTSSSSPSWESPGFDPYENVAAKVIRASSTGNAFDMDLLDPVPTTPSWPMSPRSGTALASTPTRT